MGLSQPKNLYMKRYYLFFLMLMFCASVLAQNVKVTGQVKNAADRQPIPGANVLVKGTSKGTTTNMDGAFTLDAKANDVLVVSFIGMKAQEIRLNGQTTLSIMMETEASKMEEVVVVGYGTSKAKDLTAPISVVKSNDIVKHATSSPMGALQGKVAGVNIVSNGQPGASPDVRIRGVGSFGDTKPLYVVDGMFFDNISFLNNNDIEDISILKDASAASIYGVRAANGVVLVTTKKGKLNSPSVITYDGYVGIQRATNKLKMASSEQYATMQLEKRNATDSAIIKNSINVFGGNLASLKPGTNTNWYNELLRDAAIQNHSLDISGGTDKATYSFGGSYLFQEGIMNAKNDYERFNLRAKTDYKVNSWLKLGANVVVSSSTLNSPNNAAWQAAYQSPSIFPVYDSRRSAADAYPEKFASPSQIGMANYFGNPVAMAKYYNDKTNATQVLPNFYAEIHLLPENKLVFKTSYNQEITFAQQRKYDMAYMVGPGQKNTNSNLNKTNNFYRNYIVDNTLTYTDQFGKHGITMLVGNSIRDDSWRNLWGNATGVPGEKEENLYISQGNAAGRTTGDDGSSYRGLSYFGRLAYSFDGKYLLSATMRADGSSKYQEKWGYFPSVGAAWVVSDEPFMKDQKVVDFLKIRASWGKLGNDKVAASDGFASVSQGLWTSGVYGSTTLPGYINQQYFSWLRWEVVNELNVGFEANFLGSRLATSFDYYRRNTENAVINAPLPMGAGYLLGNNGEIRNSGFEVTASWSDKINNDFSYTVGMNLTTIKNEVVSLNGLPYLYGGSAEFRTISKIGEPLNAYYGHEIAGVYQNAAQIAADPIAVANGLKPGDFKYVDQNKDGVIDDKDRVILGSPTPDFTYGFNVGLSYKNLEFSAVFQGQSGNEIVNRKRGDRRWQSDINYDEDMVVNRWTGEGSTNSYPSAAGSVNPWNISKFNSFYIEDGSYFRIQNVQLAYTLSKRKIGTFNLPTIRFSVMAERPYTYFKSNGFTPEVANGFDSQVYPLAATYSFGIRIVY